MTWIWEQLSWVVWAQGLSCGCSQDVGRSFSPLGVDCAWVTCFQRAKSLSCWLEAQILHHMSLSTDLLRILMTWHPPEQKNQRKTMRKLQCLLWSDLWSHTYIHRCFHFILFVRNKSLSLVHIQGEENYVPTLERRNIEKLMDITWWNRVGNKSCKHTLKIHMLISTAFPAKCNHCPDFCDFCFLVFLYNFTTNCEPLNNTDCFFLFFELHVNGIVL